MFLVPAVLAFILDTSLCILCIENVSFELAEIHSISKVFWTLVNPIHCSVTLLLFTGIIMTTLQLLHTKIIIYILIAFRILHLLRLVHRYQQNYRIRGTAGISFYLCLNFAVCLLRVRVIYFVHEGFQAFVLMATHLVSFYCHVSAKS